MNPFELFFSLLGLILGLAIATVISGLSDVLRQRDPIRVGWLTPLLALFVLLDLSSVWVNAWQGLSDIKVAYGPFVAAVVVAGIYFFAASMVFPKVSTDWESLDDYYMGHYRWVLGGVMVASIGLVLIEAAASNTWRIVPSIFISSPVASLWWATLVVLFVVRRTKVQLAGMVLLQLITAFVLCSAWVRG